MGEGGSEVKEVDLLQERIGVALEERDWRERERGTYWLPFGMRI